MILAEQQSLKFMLKLIKEALMMNNIKGSTFAIYLAYKLVEYPDCVIKSIGTNQTHFIILVETPDGSEHKIYIPCEE